MMKSTFNDFTILSAEGSMLIPCFIRTVKHFSNNIRVEHTYQSAIHRLTANLSSAFLVLMENDYLQQLSNFRTLFRHTFLIIFIYKSSLLEINALNENVRPQGLWHTDDVNSNNLKAILEFTISSKFYHSASIQKSLILLKSMAIDKWDLKLLDCLNKGILNKDLTTYLPGSKATIDRRKRRLKIKLGVQGKPDHVFLKAAKNIGFLNF